MDASLSALHRGNPLRIKNDSLLFALAFTAGVLQAALPAKSMTLPEDPAGRAMLQAAQRIIAGYHERQPRVTNQLRVIYFVPKDSDPLPNHEARLDRVVTDVSDFYRDAFLRFGIQTAGLPLERKDEKLVIHLVKGRLPAGEYHYDSGD